MFKLFFYLLFFLSVSITEAGITAEDVLGEYWKDPLFGEAAESHTVYIEVLNGRVWPEHIKVPNDETIRFVFFNKSTETHLFAFTSNLESLLSEDSFQMFIKDELFHAKKEAQSDPRAHTHSSSSVDDAEAIVKSLEQRPTVLIKPDDTKEILVRFSRAESIELRCAIPGHNMDNLKGVIEVVESE